MPLFDQFQVKDSSISKIVATDSHSSLKMLYNPMMATPSPVTPSSNMSINSRINLHHQNYNAANSNRNYNNYSSSNRRSNGGLGPMTVSSSDEEMPPPVAVSSGSDSSGRRR